MANTYTYPSADLHSVPDVYPVADTDIHTLAGSHGRADVHTVPDLYALAYVHTDTCSHCYGGAYTDSDSDSANGDTSAGGHGSTNTYADCHPNANS